MANKIYTSQKDVNLQSVNKLYLDSYSRLRVSSPTIQLEMTQDHPTYRRHISDMEISGEGTSSDYEEQASVTHLRVSNLIGLRRLRSRICATYLTGKSLTIYLSYCFNSTQQGVIKRVGFFDEKDGIFLECHEGNLSWVLRSSVSGEVLEKKVEQSQWDNPDLPSDTTLNGDIFIKIPWISNGNVECGFLVDGVPITTYVFDNSGSNKPFIRTCNLYPTFEIERFQVGLASDDLTVISYAVLIDGDFDKIGNNYSIVWGVQKNLKNTGIKNSIRPLIFFRLDPEHSNTVIIPVKSAISTKTDRSYYLHLFKNPTIYSKNLVVTNPANWKTLKDTGLQYDIYPDGSYYIEDIEESLIWTGLGGNNAGMDLTAFNTIDTLGVKANGEPEIWVLAISSTINNEIVNMATIDFLELK